MGDKTSIGWTAGDDGSPGSTWNPFAGCSIVSPGCTNCYAMKMAGTRLDRPGGPMHYRGTTKPSKAGPVWSGRVREAPGHIFDAPLRWTRPRKIFVNSMSDLFHPGITDNQIDRVFAIMAMTPRHTFQILTKRPERMRAYIQSRSVPDAHGFPAEDIRVIITFRSNKRGEDGKGLYCKEIVWPLPNVWLGTSVEDQTRADERIPDLLATPAAVRFVSAEPLLGPIDLKEIDLDGESTIDAFAPLSSADHWRMEWAPEVTGTSLEEAIEGFTDWGFAYPPSDELPRGLDWVIIGAESGSGARPMDPAWAVSLVEQTKAAKVACFMKQLATAKGQKMADIESFPPELRVREYPA